MSRSRKPAPPGGDRPTLARRLLTDNDIAPARVQRSRLEPFVKAGRTIRKHRDGILAAIRLGLTNARLEGLILSTAMKRVLDVAHEAA